MNRRELLTQGVAAGAVTAGEMFHLPETRKAMPDDASVAVPRANGLGWVDVRDHGATGDGVTDDRAAVVAAANLAAEATDRSTLYFPAGTYLINDGPPPSIGDNVTVVGEGAASVLKRGAGATYFALLVNRDYAENTAGNRNIAIHNLSFDANGANQDPPFDQFKHCIALIGVRNAVVRGCRFYNLSGDGVVVSSTSDATDRPNQSRMIRIVENDFEGGTNGRNGISIIDAADVVISSNTFTGVAADTHPGGIDLEPDLPGQDITNVIVVGNTFENCRQGIQAYGGIRTATGVKRGLVITGNTVRGSRNQGMGIRVSAWDQVSVTGNTIAETAHSGIFLEDANQVAVSGNAVRGSGLEETAPGIWLKNCPYIVVTGNTVHDSQGDAYRVDRCDMFTLSGNSGRGWDNGNTGRHYGIRGVNRCVGGIVTANTFDGGNRPRTTLLVTQRGCRDWNVANNLFRNVGRKFNLSGRNRVADDSN